jgi:type III secretion system TyeA family effector delivery regulator
MSDRAELSRLLLREILVLATSAFVQASSVARLLEHLPHRDLDAKIYFLQAYLEFVRGIPEKIYPNGEIRPKLLEAIQDNFRSANLLASTRDRSAQRRGGGERRRLGHGGEKSGAN